MRYCPALQSWESNCAWFKKDACPHGLGKWLQSRSSCRWAEWSLHHTVLHVATRKHSFSLQGINPGSLPAHSLQNTSGETPGFWGWGAIYIWITPNCPSSAGSASSLNSQDLAVYKTSLYKAPHTEMPRKPLLGNRWVLLWLCHWESTGDSLFQQFTSSAACHWDLVLGMWLGSYPSSTSPQKVTSENHAVEKSPPYLTGISSPKFILLGWTSGLATFFIEILYAEWMDVSTTPAGTSQVTQVIYLSPPSLSACWGNWVLPRKLLAICPKAGVGHLGSWGPCVQLWGPGDWICFISQPANI